jgi:3-phenylpropionate/trans-cinnamate dioxygenase ferredoxin subunit
MPFQTVCRTSDVPVGGHRAATAGATRVVVYHLKDGWYATQASCTHVFAPLAKGKLVDDCKIQCPLHRARFDVRTGAVVDWANWPPGIINVINAVRGEKALRTYKVRVQGDEVQVDA